MSGKLYCYILGLIAAAWLIGCNNGGGSNPVAGELGPGTEVIGKVVDTNGQPVAQALAVLRRADHLAVTAGAPAKRAVDSTSTYTDDAGVFIFKEIDSGEYRIEVLKQYNSGEDIAALFSFSANDSIQSLDLHTDTVLPVITLNGSIDTTGFRGLFSGYIFAPGLDKAAQCSGDGSFSLDGIPQHQSIDFYITAQTGTVFLDSSLRVSTRGISPIQIPEVVFPIEYARDTLAVRTILDTNGHITLSVTAVAGFSGTIVDILRLDTMALTVLPASIGELSELKTLFCEGNVLAGLPDELASCISLRHVGLSNNNFSSIPDVIFSLDSLRHLEIASNEIDSVPRSITSLVNLETFYIQTNYISEIPPELFGLPHLKHLSFAKNRVLSLPPETGQCTTLVKLSISDNRIDSLPKELCSLVNLQEFLCGRNLLDSIPSCLGTLPDLFSIELHENELVSFPIEFVSNYSISHLKVDHNRLCSPAVPDSVRSWFDIKQPGWDTTQVCQ
ncbi:MAG: hypothetical protein GF398_08725 [Chitinivibrionales bacterium]|nr:hypothetical protein [Chitinivibrionales bacterium]